MIKKLILSACFLLVACSQKSMQKSADNGIPTWGLTPQSESIMTVSECVIATNNASFDKHHALTLARASLAQAIQTQVIASNKLHQDEHVTTDISVSNSHFNSRSYLQSEQYLSTSKVIKVAIVDIYKVRHCCLMLGLDTAE